MLDNVEILREIFISVSTSPRQLNLKYLFINLLLTFQGENLIIANVGDSRVVLATTSEDGTLFPLQLTTDFKPNLPSEIYISLFSSSCICSINVINLSIDNLLNFRGGRAHRTIQRSSILHER